MSDSPYPSSDHLEDGRSYQIVTIQPDTHGINSVPSTFQLSAPPPPRRPRQKNSDNLKSFKVSLDDPAWKVLPAAMRKYKIDDDDWQNYAMFICYGPPSTSL